MGCIWSITNDGAQADAVLWSFSKGGCWLVVPQAIGREAACAAPKMLQTVAPKIPKLHVTLLLGVRFLHALRPLQPD